MISSDAPRVLLPSNTMRLDRRTEDKVVAFVKERVSAHREAAGWDAGGIWRRGSWGWKRLIASRMFEQDFEHRKAERSLYAASNMSLNMPLQFVEQHKSRIVRNLLKNDTFFGIIPEGPEDQSDVLRDVERWLHSRGRKARLCNEFRSALTGILVRGEAVAKTTLRVKQETEDLRVRPLMSNGMPFVDPVTGRSLTDRDEAQWEPDPGNPARVRHRSLPHLSLPAGVPREYGEEHITAVVLRSCRGAHVSFPHWGDLVIPVNATHLDNAELIAHRYQMAACDMMDQLEDARLNQVAKKAYLESVRGRGVEGDDDAASERSQPNKRQGEDETAIPEPSGDLSYRERMYVEAYLRMDWRGTGRYERVAILFDWQDMWPIYYGPVAEMMPWTDAPHPFTVSRVFPVEERWYGRGYFEHYHDEADFADLCWNRAELELRTSGRKIVENKDKHLAGRAGLPLNLRSPETLQVEGSTLPEEVLKVVEVPPRAEPILGTMDIILQKLQSRAGVIGPGDPQSEALNNSNTLGEAEIAEGNKSVSIEERESEITDGLNAVLKQFAEIELDERTMDHAALRRLMETTAPPGTTPLPQVIPQQAQPSAASAEDTGPRPAVASVEIPQAEAIEPPGADERVEAVMEWVRRASDDLGDVIKIHISASRDAQALPRARAKLDTLDRWMALPPAVRRAQRTVYADILRALDEPNPDALLGHDSPEEMPPPPPDPTIP